jgi:rhodanese-related sulfurtransferase
MLVMYAVAVFVLLPVAVGHVSPALAETAYKIITTRELQAVVEGKSPFTLVDARTKEEYEDAHIVKAINISEKGFAAESAQLPADKGALVIFYCNGVKCGKSKKVAKLAEALGYTNIALYSDGFPVWEEKNLTIVPGATYGKKIETARLSPADVEKLIKAGKQDYVIVDVRDDMEFEEGHIPTAINIPAETFAVKSEVLPKEKKIVVYCNTGSRSYMAYRKLVKLAYPNIYQTLFADWKEAKLAVAKK